MEWGVLMARYIDAYKLEQEFKTNVSKYNVTIDGSEYPVFLVDHTLHKVRNFPTADVVEVVRCKDCKYKEQCCEFTMISGRDKSLDFCSYGERRDT